MSYSWQDFIDTFFNGPRYKKLYHDTLINLLDCQAYREECAKELTDAKDKIRQLELLVPHPTPPEVVHIIKKDTVWIQAVLEDLGADVIRLPLDAKYRLTNKDTFLDIIAWDWIDSIKYTKDIFDCENFAIAFKSHVDEYFGLNQVGIVIDYQSGHAYNIVIFPNGKVMLLEPQSDGLFTWEEDAIVFYNLKGAFVII